MGAGVGFGLLKSVIDNAVALSTLVENGVDDTYFQGDEKKAYTFIRDYFTDYSTFPELQTVSIEIQNDSCFEGLPSGTHEFWIDKVKERKRHRMSQKALRDIDVLLKSNVNGAVDLFGTAYSELRSTYIEFSALDLKEAERAVLNKHDRLQQGGRLVGVPFGFPYLDSKSGGAQTGDSIIIAGVTGAGKSYLALRMALTAWYSGYSVLFLCTEMPAEQVARRLLAMECSFDATHLKLGRLSYYGVQRADETIRSPLYLDGEVGENFFKLLPGGLYSRLEDIQIVTKDLKPDLLVVDGASLVRMPKFKGNKWERMIEVAENIKNLAMREDIAILSTYHFGKQSAGTAEGMYGGAAMGQLASIVMAFEFERKEDMENPNPIQWRILKLLKGRDGERGTVRVLFNMLRSTIVQDRVISGQESLDFEEEEIVYTDNNPYEEI